ncbi:uncharacterized protein A1O9_00086 [Exophiala aquamarina CBS 119918]|uniref:Uncharacterized protein n=1 Tax=Exophiala aquamarina CBS 119918 TaxID=1182545 RepID=A0A072PPS0_9EURO|nr:uncharacterized protein A1O9_00086 [Exophiala aquamarina CBS 119918]KEF62114.1 hypothetical protein A1O9_00086 [Exophiala aquamarina CBS 119918]
MQWEWSDNDEWLYGRRWQPIRSGWGCFSRTHWVPMNEYYRARNSRRIRITFQMLAIAPVVWEPQIHYVLLNPLNHLHFGGGWHLPPFVFPHTGGDGDGDDWRLARHREHIARLDGEISEIANRPQGYLDELARGWQVGGAALDDNPDRMRLGQLWREVDELRHERDRLQRHDIDQWRQIGQDRDCRRQHEQLQKFGIEFMRHEPRTAQRTMIKLIPTITALSMEQADMSDDYVFSWYPP